jgi:hypothetical protein
MAQEQKSKPGWRDRRREKRAARKQEKVRRLASRQRPTDEPTRGWDANSGGGMA